MVAPCRETAWLSWSKSAGSVMASSYYQCTSRDPDADTGGRWLESKMFIKEQFSLCGSNPKKFWKTVKDLENKPFPSQLPMSLNGDHVVVTDY